MWLAFRSRRGCRRILLLPSLTVPVPITSTFTAQPFRTLLVHVYIYIDLHRLRTDARISATSYPRPYPVHNPPHTHTLVILDDTFLQRNWYPQPQPFWYLFQPRLRLSEIMLLPRVLPGLLGHQRLLPAEQVRVKLVQLALLLPIVILLAIIHVVHAVVIRRDRRVVHLDRPLLRTQNLSLHEQEHLLCPLHRELGQQTSLPLFELSLALVPARRRHVGDDDLRAQT